MKKLPTKPNWIAADRVVYSENGGVVAVAEGGPHEEEANAVLISAVHDLKEALILMIHSHREPHDKEGLEALEKAKAAIEKSEAKS